MSDKPEILPFWLRVLKCARDNIKPALSVIGFLLRIMLPVSFAVMLLKTSGVLFYVSRFMNPLMSFLGLPGEAALAYISAIFINIYSAIAVIETLSLTGKQLIILATMCLIAHNFFVECVVLKKAGSSFRKMVVLRLFNSLLAGLVMSFIVPGQIGSFAGFAAKTTNPHIGLNLALFLEGLGPWFRDSVFLVLQIFLIVFAVMFLQRLLAEFGLIKRLSRIAAVLMGFLGLSADTAYVWLIANTVGVAYGAGVIIDEVREGSLSRVDADLFNHHAAISHSQIEDTVLFVSLGAPYLWIALPRFILAIIVVWVERARRAIFRSSFRVKIV
ncbi:putative membrane protein YvoD [Spirochaetia bacterium]|nr:putative membrane protein YvoD [Spirochaetia bacterium]